VATYAHNSLSLTWKAPKDTGCLPIQGYKFQVFNSVSNTWGDATS